MGTYCFGIDVGGTTVKCGLFRTDGTLVEKWEIPTRKENNGDQILPDVAAAVNAKIEEKGISKDDVEGVGIGVPGPVNSKGEVDRAVNLYWGYKNVAGEMEELTGLHAKAGNDANVAALGEALAGCAKGAESAVILTLGTGVGAGVVLGGKLLTGYTGAASEAGHMVIADTPDAPLCTCGRRGCFESLASATALIRMTRTARRTHPESLLNTLAPTEADVNGRTVFDAAAQGDAAAKAVADNYIHHLAVGVANLINIFFPEVIGLSGGVANQGENLLKPLRAAAAPMVFGSAFAEKHTRITTCTLGYRAGVIGAALLAKQEV